jgi:hypothetical protein
MIEGTAPIANTSSMKEKRNDRNRRTQTSAGYLLASVDVIEFQTTVEYSNLDLNKQSREENLEVMERIRSNSFTHSENMKSPWSWKCNFESKETLNTAGARNGSMTKLMLVTSEHLIIIIIIIIQLIY